LQYLTVAIGVASPPISTVKFCNKVVISLISNRLKIIKRKKIKYLLAKSFVAESFFKKET
jgi:hypothetical protein